MESCRDSELLKSFCSLIQDGRNCGHLEILQTTSPPKTVGGIEPKIDGRHWRNIKFQNC